ncbi:MAG: ATP-binding protein [Lachnospiraceae bacterium]|nr:ATP-binding protein [Lachnospiraceae bacterium]
MFIGRENELKALGNRYKSDKFEFVVIYGRRRVGKTALINQFIGDKKSIYFMGVESNMKQNLENFSKSIIEFCSGVEAETSFASFQAALEFVFQLAEKERIILVIDEYPYVARSSKSLASTLQLLIDKYKDTSKLMLILCGSSMSYMEDHVLAYKAPLYGRRTAQMKIQPFDFEESCQYLQNLSDEDKALIYGIVGGTPQYLLQMNDKLSVEENIKNTYLNPVSFLYEEPINLLKQEVREPAIYTAIITAIATGYSRMSEISTKVGEYSNVCSNYIKNLINLGIVQKETPYGEKASKKSIYSIEDNMFYFWYRFVLDNMSIIARGASDLVYKRIEPQLSNYMGRVFEEICKQYLWKQLLAGNTPIEFNSLGRWWGNDPIQRSQAEIDIMGEQDADSAIFAECKWRNEMVDTDILETLIRRSRLFQYRKVHYYLFSKSGFTKGCMDRAKEEGNVSLIRYGQMLKN